MRWSDDFGRKALEIRTGGKDLAFFSDSGIITKDYSLLFALSFAGMEHGKQYPNGRHHQFLNGDRRRDADVPGIAALCQQRVYGALDAPVFCHFLFADDGVRSF